MKYYTIILNAPHVSAFDDFCTMHVQGETRGMARANAVTEYAINHDLDIDDVQVVAMFGGHHDNLA